MDAAAVSTRPDDVILQKTPVTFDVSVWELMWWAMAGASVALLEPGGRARSAQDRRRSGATSGHGDAFRAVDAWPILGSTGGAA